MVNVPSTLTRLRRLPRPLFIPGKNIARWGETIVIHEPEGREFDSGPIYVHTYTPIARDEFQICYGAC